MYQITAYITCPGSYRCDEEPGNDVRMCVTMAKVCDGKPDCSIGDDEEMCGENKIKFRYFVYLIEITWRHPLQGSVKYHLSQ